MEHGEREIASKLRAALQRKGFAGQFKTLHRLGEKRAASDSQSDAWSNKKIASGWLVPAFFVPMDFPWATTARCCAIVLACLLAGFPASAQQKGPASTPNPKEAWSGEPMIDLAKVCPAICIELRYATARNLTGKPIYPVNARCLVRESVAQRLRHAQWELHAKGFGLKIWDAYRPGWAQEILWKARPNPEFLQAPSRAASMHTKGVAVDATLVDLEGHALRMPTDFDDFSPAAQLRYSGGDPEVAKRLRTLQIAMGNAGFVGMSNEWWHFVAKDYAKSRPVDMSLEPENKTE